MVQSDITYFLYKVFPYGTPLRFMEHHQAGFFSRAVKGLKMNNSILPKACALARGAPRKVVALRPKDN